MRKNKVWSIRYWWIPIFSMILINTIAYTGTKLVTDSGYHFDISLPIDFAIPFIPAFIIIYILSYLQWVVGYGLIAAESKEVCYRVISSEIIAKLICLVIFLILPTTMSRPENTGEGILGYLVNLIYSADTPTTLLPSVHCLESWILFRTAHKITRFKKWLVPLWFIFAILVFASVVFVKQHLILDIPAAILVGEIGLFLGKKFKTERFFEKINRKFLKGE
ncbi:MAG: phosphatidic acid phosphatase [Ruminococcaceae bacterium]|nr:phosphatidic acid phosphatase [Oscillospiraceae bacterium]